MQTWHPNPSRKPLLHFRLAKRHAAKLDCYTRLPYTTAIHAR